MEGFFSSLWFWYLLGAVLTLVWKWQRYCYESKGRGISFKKASVAWLEIQTFQSKISWITTIAIVWALGAAFIQQEGLAWLFGGVLAGMPTIPAFAFLLGVFAELLLPAFMKWFLSKFPGAGNGK